MQVCTMAGDLDVMYSVAFSPNGTRVWGSGEKLVKIWDAEPGAEVSSFVGVCSK